MEEFGNGAVVCVGCENVYRKNDRLKQKSKETFEIRIRQKLFSANRTCKEKNMEFNITLQDVLNLWEKQNGKCFYTGVQMSQFRGDFGFSVDRVDSSRGYVLGNCVLAATVINRMKLHHSVEEFINFCKMVVDFNLK